MSTSSVLWRTLLTSAAVAFFAPSVQSADPVLLKGHNEVVYDAVFLPDGKQVVTASFDRTLKLWDLATQQSVRTMEGHTGIILTVAVSKDGTLIASGASDNTIRLWDVPKNDPVKTLNAHDAAGTALAVSLDGQFFASGDASGVVRIWNVESGEKTQELKLSASISRLAWRRDRNQLAAATKDGRLHVINPADGQVTAVIGAHAEDVTGLVFSPNNQQIYSSGADGLVKRWPSNVVATVTATGHNGAINAISQHPNGSLIATAGQDGTARIFNRTDGKQARTFEGHGGPGSLSVPTVRRSPRRVPTGSRGCSNRIRESWSASFRRSRPDFGQ